MQVMKERGVFLVLKEPWMTKEEALKLNLLATVDGRDV